MDLHLIPGAEATAAEKAAVDAALSTQHSAPGTRRSLLLPALHAAAASAGWISAGAINYICERLDVPPADAFGVASFYAFFATAPRPPVVARVCDDIACRTKGGEHICGVLEQRFGPAGAPVLGGSATWLRTPCLGQCDRAPAALVTAAGNPSGAWTMTGIAAADVERAMAQPSPAIATNARPAVYADAPRLLTRIGKVNPESLADYKAQRGYAGLQRAMQMPRAQIIDELIESKLAGRGGAAFPTGRKWKAVADAPAQPHYVVCNADESEPGTFKDRVLMEGDPFAILEGMTIAAFTTGSSRGYIYLRAEYPIAAERLANAIQQARTAGLLGANIMGTPFSFDIEIRRGAGAYICGEETALFNSIEGFRGEPRNKPPFPVESGLFRKPTVVNNVETLASVVDIFASSGRTYATIGTEQSTGTRLFCLSGAVSKPGVYEVPMGTTLRSLIEMAGGVAAGRNLQAVLLGGAAGVFMRPDELDMPLSFEGARAAAATLGSGVVMLFDDSVDMRDITRRIAAFFRDESCGQCVPCRVGTIRQEEILHHGVPDVKTIDDVAQVMRDASICGLGQTAASAVQSAFRKLPVFQRELAP